MSKQTPARRLSAADVRALRRAGQRELKRWARVEPDPERQRRSADLRQALRVLREFRGGCELRPICEEDHGQGSG